jgi:hypothetical protein
VFAGSLREIHVAITGSPDDYAVEVASGACFGAYYSPALWINCRGPIGLASGARLEE